jgi:hypothetical protein
MQDVSSSFAITGLQLLLDSHLQIFHKYGYLPLPLFPDSASESD